MVNEHFRMNNMTMKLKHIFTVTALVAGLAASCYKYFVYPVPMRGTFLKSSGLCLMIQSMYVQNI